MKKKPIIGLALSGGGALGIAHIGAISALKDNGINVDIVAGTSIGSVVGAAYACGMQPNEMFEIARKIKTINLLDVNLATDGLLSGKAVTRVLKKIIGDKTFENCKIPFACVATDLLTGEPVVLNSGELVEAVRASISVPGVFSPVKRDGCILIDGGLSNNLPDDIVRKMGADIVIGVDLINSYSFGGAPKFVTKTIVYSFMLMQYNLNKLRKNHSNVVVKPHQPDVKQWTFNEKVCKIGYEAGYNAVVKNIKKIKKCIEKFNENEE